MGCDWPIRYLTQKCITKNNIHCLSRSWRHHLLPEIFKSDYPSRPLTNQCMAELFVLYNLEDLDKQTFDCQQASVVYTCHRYLRRCASYSAGWNYMRRQSGPVSLRQDNQSDRIYNISLGNFFSWSLADFLVSDSPECRVQWWYIHILFSAKDVRSVFITVS